MKRTLRLLALIAGLTPAIAAAQNYLPPDIGLPPQSVIGNPLTVPGNAVAVSFAQFRAQFSIPAQACSSHNWFNSLSGTGVLGCAQPGPLDIGGLGTGIATALATNTGTAGAPVLFNGAGGTPASINLANATAYPNATNAVKGVMEGDGATINCVAGVCTSIGTATTAVTLLTTTAVGGTAGDLLSLTSTGCSSTTPCMTQFAVAPNSNYLGSDVSLGAGNTLTNGPTISVGTAGTWDVTAKVTLIDTSVAATFPCKLYDGGSNIYDSAKVFIPSAGFTAEATLKAIVSSSTTGNFVVACEDTASASGSFKFNASGFSKDSGIWVKRVQ